jgi:hypothetical protein
VSEVYETRLEDAQNFADSFSLLAVPHSKENRVKMSEKAWERDENRKVESSCCKDERLNTASNIKCLHSVIPVAWNVFRHTSGVVVILHITIQLSFICCEAIRSITDYNHMVGDPEQNSSTLPLDYFV